MPCLYIFWADSWGETRHALSLRGFIFFADFWGFLHASAGFFGCFVVTGLVAFPTRCASDRAAPYLGGERPFRAFLLLASTS